MRVLPAIALLALLLSGCACRDTPPAPPGFFYCERCNEYFKRDSHEDVWTHLQTHYFEDALKPKPKPRLRSSGLLR